MTEPERGFKEEKKTVPMHIYDADPDDAKWFKQWCDGQGIKFNMGIKLIRLAVEKDTMYRNIMDVMAGQSQEIENIKLAMSEFAEKDVAKPRIKKTYGSNLQE